MEDPKQVIADYIAFRGGKRVIQRILVANNGLAAVRFMRRLREWSFEYLGSEKALHFICMPTPEDIEANAEYFRLADEFKVVPGGSNKNNFAKVELIVEIAKQVKADAVWPGWGHASEYPALPNGLEKAGIVFMGPSGRSMDAVGDKICANLLAQSVGVNVIPWSGSGLKSDGVELSPELIKQATLASVEECVESAKKVGFPLMIKASEGGGGKGVRKAKCRADIIPMFRQVADEVKGSPIFLMRLCDGARHIEVQVMSDKHRNVSILSGRDCSMQRRFQKIVEEGPPTAVKPETMRQMELAAARLSLMVDYTHAGTVEYLFLEETGEFFFLELNPRLQVEHPVTEGITGANIPSLQLMVSMGIDITRLPPSMEINKFIVDVNNPSTDNPFDRVNGHTIAVRITAENAADGWKPTVGTIDEISFQSLPSVWGYFSVKTPDRKSVV